MRIGIPRETFPNERRVALIPASIPALSKAGFEILVEAGAGSEAGFPDAEYKEKGAKIAGSRAEIFSSADIVLQVRTLGANPEAGRADLDLLRKDQVVIGFGEPLGEPKAAKALAERGVTAGTIAGYKAVLLAADALPKIFPMLMTAAGTLAPARVFIVGVGVAGLQAIATASRLGAVVHAYDVRPAVKEQVESLGAKFVELPLEASEAEDKGGYAKAMGEEFYKKQRELMARVLAESDVVITTAAVPGKKAPVLVTGEMVKGMVPHSVIVDLAAERGGNCELTRSGETVVEHGVTIIGPVNIPSSTPYHASQMYAKNVSTFLMHIVKDGKLQLDMEDEITHDTMTTRGGEVVNPRVREILGLAPAASTQKKES
jgi:NAD(P) transhydrogenase subunit alpha